MFKIIVALISSLSLCFLLFFLNVTTPATVGPFGVLLIFVCAYLLSLGLMTYSFYLISYLIAKFSSVVMTRKPITPLTFKMSYYYSTIIAIVPIMLIGLQSVGSVGLYEVLLVTLFVFIGVLYVSKK
jgi:hypothetical protein